MITSERLYEILVHVREHYEYMAKVDEELRICGYGSTYKPELHIYEPEEFRELCKLTGADVSYYPPTNSTHITVEGVKIFVVGDHRYE